MNTGTTLDYKSLIKDWQNFQRNKLKMANAFPCSIRAGQLTAPDGILSFLSLPGEPHIKLTTVSSGFSSIIFIGAIRGYNSDENRIQLTLRPGLGQAPIMLTFPTEEVHAVALTSLQNFTGGVVRELTPPSSESD